MIVLRNRYKVFSGPGSIRALIMDMICMVMILGFVYIGYKALSLACVALHGVQSCFPQ